MPCVVKVVTDLKMKLKSCTLACFRMVVKVDTLKDDLSFRCRTAHFLMVVKVYGKSERMAMRCRTAHFLMVVKDEVDYFKDSFDDYIN